MVTKKRTGSEQVQPGRKSYLAIERACQCASSSHRKGMALPALRFVEALGRGAALGEVRLRPVGADRLALPLLGAQPADEHRAEEQPDHQRGRARRPGPKADVADQVEDSGESQLFGDNVQH